MKKFLLAMVAFFATISFSANAQTVSADFSALDQLVLKLNKALEKTPKPSGVDEVDKFLDGNIKAAVGAIESAALLDSLYKREVGQNMDGIVDVTVKKPTLEEWTALAITLTTQTEGLAKVTAAGKDAAEAVKKADKLKAAKLAKPIKWSSDLLPVTGEALAEEAKAVNQIIQTLKTANNL